MATPRVALPVINSAAPDLHPDNQSHRKVGIACDGCDLQAKPRVPGVGYQGHVDIMLVSESPSSWSSNNREMFYGRGGRIIRQVWKELRTLDARNGGELKMALMRKWETYAVQCQVEEGRDQSAPISAATLGRCANYLKSAALNKRPKVILAFGATALKALGYRGGSFMEVRGRLLKLTIDGVDFQVLPTFSTKHVVAKTGLYNLFYADFVRAVRIASGVEEAGANATLEELSALYVMPKTVAEVAAVCDTIIAHVVDGAKHAAQCALAVDTETNTLDPQRKDAKVLCASFAWDTGRATAIPLFHAGAWWTPQELVEVVGHVQRVLACPKPKIFHNAKFDLKFLELRHGWRVNNVMWDTLLGEHLLREDMAGAYSLKVLGRSYFPAFGAYADGIKELSENQSVIAEGVASAIAKVRKGKFRKGARGIEGDQLCEWGKKDIKQYLYGTKKDQRKTAFAEGFERVPIDTLLMYAAVDTDLTRRLLRHQFGRMQQEHFVKPARSLMDTHCIPASRALGRMEFDGFPVDLPYVNKIETELEALVAARRAALDEHWVEDAGKPFNPNSTAHIGKILYSTGVRDPVTGIATRRDGDWIERNKKSQQYKTDKKTLQALVERLGCPFSKTLLEYRAAHKALTGFVKEIKELSSYDGRLHASFHLHGTSTGRTSSSNPNMQNQPKKLAGVNIKKIFVPDDPETEVIFNVDWRGAEIRVFTAYAPDEALIAALKAGQDSHSWFTQEIFGIPYAEVEARRNTDEDIAMKRQIAKRVVFGILYGAMARKIAETAGISEEEAQRLIDKLFERFPSLRNYMDEVVAQIRTQNHVETLFGRRRRFPLQAVNGFFAGMAERRGKNMKIQSTSSDIVIAQLVEISEHLHELGGRLCITVHDSIVGIIKKKHLAQARAFFDRYCVDRVAEKFPWLPVPFAYDLEVGPSYGETMALDKYLAKYPLPDTTGEEDLLALLDDEALQDLREDEDEAREKSTDTNTAA